MQKNIITNKITPCCGLPFSVIHWWVSNLTLNSESDRQFILSKISQGGVLSIDAWKVLINSGTLEADASLTKVEFLAWFNCEKQPSCEQLKLIIEGYKMGSWVGDLSEISFVNVLGVLEITDTAPTTQGLYILSDIGTYTNLGGLVTTTGKINYAYFDGTTWSLVYAEINGFYGHVYNLQGSYTLTTAINAIPSTQRKSGLIITFQDSEDGNMSKSFQYTNESLSGWQTLGNWQGIIVNSGLVLKLDNQTKNNYALRVMIKRQYKRS